MVVLFSVLLFYLNIYVWKNWKVYIQWINNSGIKTPLWKTKVSAGKVFILNSCQRYDIFTPENIIYVI